MKAKLIVSTRIGGKMLKPGEEIELQDAQYADFLKRGLVEKTKQAEEKPKDKAK